MFFFGVGDIEFAMKTHGLIIHGDWKIRTQIWEGNEIYKAT